MAIVTKTFAFASDAEGLTDTGNALTGSWDSGDGSPANGCLKITGTDSGADAGAMATSGTTFASWGVPGGATINGIEIKSAKIKSSDVSAIHTINFSMGSSPTWGADLGSPSAVSANTWESATGPGYVDLTAYSLTSASACIATFDVYSEYVGVVTLRIDTVVVDITYTAGGGGGGSLSIPVAMNSYRQRRV